MRRMLGRVLLITLVALAFDWAPSIPPDPLLGVAQVRGQTFPLPIAPGGAIVYSNASESCVNTASECQMFQWIVPAGYTATATSIGALVSPWLDGRTASGLNLPVIANSPQPLHLRMLGSLNNAAGDGIAIGVNFGGNVGSGLQVATLYLSNTIVTANNGAGAERPVRLDVWLSPIASSTATPSGSSTVGQMNLFMVARVEFANGITATPTIISSQSIASANLASPTQLNVLVRWGAASNASSVRFYNRLLKFGE